MAANAFYSKNVYLMYGNRLFESMNVVIVSLIRVTFSK